MQVLDRVLVSRFTATGGLHATLGAGGTVLTDVDGAVVEGVAVQGDDTILMAGAGGSSRRRPGGRRAMDHQLDSVLSGGS